METIIGLLFILLPVIFKLIEKKLQASGKVEQAAQARKIADLFSEDDSSSEYDGEESAFEESAEPLKTQEIVFPQKPEPVKMPTPNPDTTFSFGQKIGSRKKKPVKVLDEPEIKKKERIDPKKLVIYSEIMKPKYQD